MGPIDEGSLSGEDISLETLFSVRGLIAVVTGGGSGIGLMIARTLEAHGAVVYILGRRADLLERVAGVRLISRPLSQLEARLNPALRQTCGNLIAVPCDVTSQESLEAAVERVKSRHPYINLLVNNAGVAHNILPSHLHSGDHDTEHGSSTGADTPSDGSPAPAKSRSAKTVTSQVQQGIGMEDTLTAFAASWAFFENLKASDFHDQRDSEPVKKTPAFHGCPHDSNDRLPAEEVGDQDQIPSITRFQRNLWSSGSCADFGASFAVNTTAPYYTTVAFLELLYAGNGSAYSKQKGVKSQVITVSSGGGFRRDASVFSVSYTLSKAASVHLGKLLANLLQDWGIRSNVVCPGIFLTDMTAFLTPAQVQAGVPLGRAGDLQDMAGLILYLSSRAGAYVNGSVQLVDGGRLGLFASSY